MTLCRNVQVTLQILTALIEKSPKDLPLFASCILRILEQILKSKDITMVESSVPTFEAFCTHHDPTSLLADQAYLHQYVSIVRQYAALASTRIIPGRAQPSKPVSLRWRNSGLEAIRSVASSEALSSVTARQYDVVVPMILENLWTDNEGFLEVLLQRVHMEEKVESGAMLRRRTSISTVRTADTSNEPTPNPLALAGTALDVDKLAEEDIGVLAMQCLKQIFVVPNRSQIHAASVALLKFIEDRVNQQEDVVKADEATGHDGGWAIKMFGLVSRWAPVQDRFTILVTAMEAMAQTPMTDDTLQHHIVLIAMVGALLRSDQNLIGLSVMDVLVQLIAHIRRLVQLPGDPNNMRSDQPLQGQADIQPPTAGQNTEKTEQIAAQRKELLVRLQQCIGDLATHVYYADQISDMIATILLKLKSPHRSNSTSSSSVQGEKIEGAAAAAQGPAPVGIDDHLDPLFALAVSKIAALKAVKSILLVANPRTKMSGNIGLARNRVPVHVWEGTHWLLRDADGHVRKAYADALLTWLERETTPADLKARDEADAHRASKNREIQASALVRRVVSSASARTEKPTKMPRTHFLQLLHVIIYENALRYVEYETDIVLLHVLLTKLVSQLGVNTVRYGLPMIFRLQEDIQDVESPVHKVRIGCLVHGYFWSITERFDCDATVVGKAIQNEIIRRRSKHFWVEGVHIPPPVLEQAGVPGMARAQMRMPLAEIESEALLPFDDRLNLVDCICTSYQESAISPPTSPAVSPGRSFTHPILNSSTLSTIPAVETEAEIPMRFREEMLAEWSREAVLEAVQAGSKSASLNESRTSGTNRNRLAVNTLSTNGHMLPPGASPSSPVDSNGNLRPSSSPAPGFGGNLSHAAKLRQSSVRSNVSPGPGSISSRTYGVTSVEQLKLVLSGELQPPPTSLPLDEDDDSSDSLVSYDMAPSELSFNPSAGDSTPDGGRRPGSRDRKSSLGGGPLSSHPTSGSELGSEDDLDSDVPPVPPLPSGIDGRVSTVAPAVSSPTKGTPSSPVSPRQQSVANMPRPSTSRRNTKSRGDHGDHGLTSSWNRTNSGFSNMSDSNGGGGGGGAFATTMDLAAMLKGIDSHAGERNLGGVTRPPY